MSTESNGGSVFPFEGICDNCLRERGDLFKHPDGNRYCADVFACEYRYYIQGEREARGLPTQASLRETAA